MPRINLKSTNSKVSITTTLIIIIYGIIAVKIPLFLINLIPQSATVRYLNEHIFIFTAIYLVIIFYFLIVCCYYYYIKIDTYVMYFSSFRTVFGLLKAKNCIEVPYDMLRQFSFFNRSFSLNKTLMLKLQNASGKIIVKRFSLSFLSEKEKLKISKVLEKIIAKNS
tara:strand:+ start:130 stop:627 length:498 start_codon:yes stop_codon:yes gene_type:complete